MSILSICQMFSVCCARVCDIGQSEQTALDRAGIIGQLICL